jgi:hypothetical protein
VGEIPFETSAALGFAASDRPFLKAEILARFLCSGNPVGVVFNFGAEGAAGVLSTISPMKAEDIDGDAFFGICDLKLGTSPSSSDKLMVNRCPRRFSIAVVASCFLLLATLA